MRRVCALIAILLLNSCGEKLKPTGKEKELAAKSVDFAFALHGELSKAAEGKNLFISPMSVYLALSMAASGAQGKTAEEMFHALKIEGWTRESLDATCGSLLQQLREEDSGVTLEVANSAWFRERFPFRPEYVKTLERFYSAETAALDFDVPSTLARINAWAKDHTHGKIPNILDHLDPRDVAVLANAVYFKGDWSKPFEKSATRPQPFHLEGGKTKFVPMMQRTAPFGYLEKPAARAIRIPYGKNAALAFFVFLPQEGISLARLQDELQAHWMEWIGNFGEQRCTLELPRFQLAFKADLCGALSSMGMKGALSPGADFSGMSPRGKELFISRVAHSTFVDVNEEGTEAAAVTAVVVQATSAPPPPIAFRVDRPFFCAIADPKAGTILFMGTVMEPM